MSISKADIFLSSDIHGYLVAFLSPFGYQAGYPGPLSVAIHEYLGYPITISTPFPGYPSILPLWALPAPPPGPLLCACCSETCIYSAENHVHTTAVARVLERGVASEKAIRRSSIVSHHGHTLYKNKKNKCPLN